MDKRLMHYQFPYDVPQIDGTMVELHRKIAAVVAETSDDAIVNAILDVAKEHEVTDLYLLDKAFILDAIREKKERENPKPLTIEELRQMDQQPVYVVPADSHDSEWCVMCNDEACIPGCDYWAWGIKDYGKTWTAYRHKPKEEE